MSPQHYAYIKGVKLPSQMGLQIKGRQGNKIDSLWLYLYDCIIDINQFRNYQD